MHLIFSKGELVQTIARRLLIMVVFWLSFPSLPAQDLWRPLFNGQDFSGWERLNGSAQYEVEEGGVIAGIYRTGSPNSFLATNEQYGDFILEVEMKIPERVNSGIQIRSQSRPDYRNGRVHGYQVECSGIAGGYSGGIYDEARRGWLYLTINDARARNALKVNEWNRYRIEAVGNRIRTWINGIPCADLVDDTDARGFIALQVHSIANDSPDAGKKVRWRNIRIRTEKLEEALMPEYPGLPQASYLDNELTPIEKARGWQLLWDGRTSKGWRSTQSEAFPQEGWVIKDGVLSVEGGGGADIITNRTYGNFVLEVDFLLSEGANSGVKYLVDPVLIEQDGTAIGCEYQLIDDENHPAAKSGDLREQQTLGALYDLIPADARLLNEGWSSRISFNGVGQWNRARIEVRGQKVTHYLNGIKIVEYERDSQMWKALVAFSKFAKQPGFGEHEQGYILLQDHGDQVSYKNIKLKLIADNGKLIMEN